MSTEPLRIAVAGCGRHGTALAQAVVHSNDLELVACADPDPSARQAIAAVAEGASAYKAVADLLAAEQVDAVLIATTHDQLAPTALTAIRAGKHVMIEKPMAMNEDQAKEIEFAAASADVTCMVGYSFRYGMAKHVTQLLADGVIGEVRCVTGAIATSGMDDGWLARADCGGGPLFYAGCHLVDLAICFMGEDPTSVSSSVQFRDTGVDETSAITLEFTGGRCAQLLVTQTAMAFFYEVRVIGSAGFIGLRGRNFVQFEVDVQSATYPAYRDPTIIHPAMRGDHITMMLVPELEDFAAAIVERRPPAITAKDGRIVLGVMDQILNSSRARLSGTTARALGAPDGRVSA